MMWLFQIAPGDIVEPLDFLTRLAALVPTPWVNLNRFHRVFAQTANTESILRRLSEAKGVNDLPERMNPTRHRRAAMTCAQRLKRVFNIDIDTCPKCGDTIKVTASIEDLPVIEKILAHLEKKAASAEPSALPPSRAPPQARLFH